jgi:hypothetical protein
MMLPAKRLPAHAVVNEMVAAAPTLLATRSESLKTNIVIET